MLPGRRAFPSAIRGLRVRDSEKVHTCFKCKKVRTRVVYYHLVTGREWPTCLPCAQAAVRLPCCVCGYVGTSSLSWSPLPEGGGRLAYHHGDGRVCYPLEVRERYTVPCSTCSAPLRFVVNASVATVHGVTNELRCSCGARWRLEGVAVGVRVYVTAA